MKKILYISILLLTTAILSQSCKKYLDTAPTEVSDLVFFDSENGALQSLAATYDPLGWYDHMQINEWAIGDVVSDDAEKGGENDADQADIHALKNFIANSENGLINEKWNAPYIGLGRANKLIEGLTDNDKIDAEIGARILAEAKFLRALYHFQLVKVFGGIPLLTQVLTENFQRPRNTIAECWAQIEIDLLAAAAGLPEKSDMAAAELGRATKGAANALLVKAYIFQEKWTEADALATVIISSGEYDLEDNYEDVFKLVNDNGIESIFDIQYEDFGTAEWGDSQEGTVTCIFQGSRENGGWGFCIPTQDLYDEFEAGDTRRDATFIEDQEVLWAGTPDEETFTTLYAENTIGYHNQKHQLPASEKGEMSEDPLNWRFIRFADVLLWQAEARANTGGDWETPLNRVRDRANMLPATETDGLVAVYHERRVELALEGHRYWDLVRTGRGNLMSGYTDNKRYFLIPISEIITNPNITQNPY